MNNNIYLQPPSTPDNSPEAIARARFYEPWSSLAIIDQAILNMGQKKQSNREAIARIAETAFGNQVPAANPSIVAEQPDMMASNLAANQPAELDLIEAARAAVAAASQGIASV